MIMLTRSSFPKGGGGGGGVSARNLASVLGRGSGLCRAKISEGVSWAWVVLVWMVVEICA